MVAETWLVVVVVVVILFVRVVIHVVLLDIEASFVLLGDEVLESL